MFSPACLSFELFWSALPSASSRSSSVALPTPSFTLPPSSSLLLSTLSSNAMTDLHVVVPTTWRYPDTATAITADRSARPPGGRVRREGHDAVLDGDRAARDEQFAGDVEADRRGTHVDG